MILLTQSGVIDSDHIADHIEQIADLLPYPLGRELLNYQPENDELEDLKDELRLEEARTDNAREVRDRVQDLINNLADKMTDQTVIDALNFIHEELNSI